MPIVFAYCLIKILLSQSNTDNANPNAIPIPNPNAIPNPHGNPNANPNSKIMPKQIQIEKSSLCMRNHLLFFFEKCKFVYIHISFFELEFEFL